MNDPIQILVQSGALGLAFFLIYVHDKERRNFGEIVQNHLKHSTKVIEKNTKTQVKLTNAINGLSKMIKENGRR